MSVMPTVQSTVVASPDPVSAVRFSPDGKWIVTSAGWKCRLYPLSGPAPEWLPLLAKALAGLPFAEDALTRPGAPRGFRAVRDLILQDRGTSDLALWGKEFVRYVGQAAE